MTAAEPLVHLENLSKIYRVGDVEVVALADVELHIEKGSFVVILGPSGCGKSTLLNMIGGLDTPTTGKITVDGINVGECDDTELTRYRREKIGFVFQLFNLVPTLTARENVQLAADLVRNPRKMDDVLRDVGLLERAEHFPNELSGGEQQRVAIARSLAKNPPILLCDEPTGELDFETGRSILSLLRRLNREEGQTLLMVTHNSSFAGVADVVLRLRSGRIVSTEVNEKPTDPMELVW
jgi:putative ABC transport system ATP-binding protein